MSHRPDEGKTLGMVLKGFPRISETFISNEIRLLEKEGCRIHIFSMRQPRESFSHASVKEIKADVTYLPSSLLLGLPVLLWSGLVMLLRHPARFRKCMGLWFKRFALAPKKHTWVKHFFQGAYLARKAEDLNLGHLHAHFAHTPTTVCLYAAHFLDIPYSFTAHAKDIYTQDPRRVEDKMRLAKFAVTCTRYNKEYIDSISPEGFEVHCVYHGIGLDLFDSNGRPTDSEAPYSIVTVARMVPKKGLDTVLHALKQLRDEGLQFKYTLMGEGTERKNVEALVSELGLDDVVELTGTITHDEVINRFRKADLFTIGCRLANDGDRDGIPNVVAESMAMGVPVAATDVSGIPELVHHEETGLLCESDNSVALADNMRRLLTDQDLRGRVIPAARQKIHDVFDNVVMTRKLANIFKKNGAICGK